MIAHLAVNAASADTKASFAPQQGGRGVASFIDHLGTANAANFTPAGGLDGSTALSSSFPLHKLAAKNDNSSNSDSNGSSAQDQAATTAAAAIAAQAPVSNTNANNAGSSATPPANPPTSSNATAPSAGAQPAHAQLNATLGGNTIQLGGASASSLIGQAGLPIGSGATNPADPTQNANGAQANNANGQTPSPLSTAATQNQLAAGATKLATQQQFSSLGLVAINDVATQTPKAASGAATTPTPGSAAAATRQGDLKPSVNAAANATQTTAPDPSLTVAPANTNAAANNPSPPGAAELNARIVAGAAKQTAQPTGAAANADDAAGTADGDANPMANPIEALTGNGKSSKGAERSANSSTVSAATLTGAQSTTSTDTRNAATTLNRNGAHDDTDAADIDSGKMKPSIAAAATPDTATSAAANAALPAAPATNTAANAPAIPGDASTRPGMVALPASEQVAVNLKQAIKDGSDEIQIQLKPASLGAIDVKLNVNHDGKLTAVISADRSDTLNLLKQDSATLQQALRDAGLNADSSSLSFNLRGGDPQAFAQNTQQPSYRSGSGSPVGDDSVASVASRGLRQHSGSIDIQV